MRITNPVELLNHFFFAGILLWFVAQHSLIAPIHTNFAHVDAAQALYHQPRLPPPMLDPEQLDASIEEAEAHSFGFAILHR